MKKIQLLLCTCFLLLKQEGIVSEEKLHFVRPCAFQCPLSIVDEVLAEAEEPVDGEEYYVQRSSRVEGFSLTHALFVSTVITKYEKMSIEHAKKIFYKIYRRLFKKLSEVKIARPFLLEFPFTADSFDLLIMFRDRRGEPLSAPQISAIEISNGVMDCSQFLPPPKGIAAIPHKDVYKRPVTSIPELQDLFNAPVLRTKEKIKIVIPIPNWEKKDFFPRDNGEFEFLHAFCKKNQFSFVISGEMKKHYFKDKDNSFGFALRGNHKLNLAQARALAIPLAHDFYALFKNDSFVKSWMADRAKRHPQENFLPEPTTFDVTFRLSFWDEDINRREAPDIAEIRVESDMFYYFTADEGQRLVLVHKESFADAMKFLEKNKVKSGNYA